MTTEQQTMFDQVNEVLKNFARFYYVTAVTVN